MYQLALIGAGRVGRAFLNYWNDSNILVVDPYAFHKSLVNYNVVDDISMLSIRNINTAIVAAPSKEAIPIILDLMQNGVNVVDASFHNGDLDHLHRQAIGNKVWYIPDAGFAPGIMNMMVQQVASKLITPTKITIYAGGVPTIRKYPWQYTATWNTKDHLEEYTRPARWLENGNTRAVMPLESDKITVDIRNIGTMEGFRSDGLRSLLNHPLAENLEEYTLRWPGFIDNMSLMYRSGLLFPKYIDGFINSIEESGAWTANPNDKDISIIQVTGHNTIHNTLTMSLIHHRDGENTSMARCTAVGIAAALEAALRDNLKPGCYTIQDLTKQSKYYRDYISIITQAGLNIETW